jgi:hypothetical protein
LSTRTVDIHITGWQDPYAGLSAYCADAQLGMGYSTHDDTDRIVSLLVQKVSQKLGEPCVLGTLTKTGQAETAELDVNDIRRQPLPPPSKKKPSRKTVPEWKKAEWGYGWEKGLDT